MVANVVGPIFVACKQFLDFILITIQILADELLLLISTKKTLTALTISCFLCLILFSHLSNFQ